MFYQAQHSLDGDLFKIEQGVDLTFPPHLHGSFEFITVTEGELEVTVDGKVYTVTNENALLVFPNQVHKFDSKHHSRHFLCIFSPKLVAAYGKVYLSRVPVSNMFTPNRDFISLLESLKDGSSILNVKGVLYSLCAAFDGNAEYKERDSENDGLLSRIFKFVENSYSGDCSLAALSEQTSYHYVYLSKFFKECTGSSFTDYVCRYRISEACYLLQNSEQTILKTAYECGFESLRSFNRNFKRIVGKTPSEYKDLSELSIEVQHF